MTTEPNPEDLYPRYRERERQRLDSQQWKDALYRKLTHKSLDIADTDDDVQINVKKGVSLWELAIWTAIVHRQITTG